MTLCTQVRSSEPTLCVTAQSLACIWPRFKIERQSPGFDAAAVCRHGWLARHELFFYLLDSLMVLAWLLVMVPLHFGVHLRKLHGEVAHLVLTAPAKRPSGFMQAEGDRTLLADAHLQDVHRYPYGVHTQVV